MLVESLDPLSGSIKSILMFFSKGFIEAKLRLKKQGDEYLGQRWQGGECVKSTKQRSGLPVSKG